MQANWIGQQRRACDIGFPYELDGARHVLRVFTTRADTIDGRDVRRHRAGASACDARLAATTSALAALHRGVP